VKGRLGGIIGEVPSCTHLSPSGALDLLTEGNVCCSSTKKFTETLEEFIAERKPDT
jgi:hypothetical protein